jgi:integrase
MSLSDAKARNSKPQAKPYKLFDGEGLFLQVTPAGSKYWRFKYLFAGREKLLAFGVYPDVSLSLARERRAEARRMLADGKDPAAAKKELKRLVKLNSENTLEAIALEWHEKKKHEWVPSHAEAVLTRLKRHVFPKLGNRPITEINAPELLSNFREVEKTGALDTMQRAMQYTGKIFMYAIATGRAERNPIPDLRGALKSPVRKNHTYLEAAELPDYLKNLEAYDGFPITKLALRFLLLTFVRTTELRAAEWTEINFEKAEWRIPAERMKMRDPHIVPLSRQSLAILRQLQNHSGNRQHIFPNQIKSDKCMSANTMIFALYRMGYHSRATGHGFRSTASTILNENGFAPDVIERQLAHSERNKVRAAYNHAQYMPERRKMMQWWADYLDEVAQKPVPANN